MTGTEPMVAIDTVAILAGGLATRMRPITETIPKAMIDVAGEPFIAYQLRRLARAGITRVVLCLGHLGQQVEAFVGDGARFGVSVAYSYDGDRLLGTGGALRKALGLLGARFFVLYGDSYLDIDYQAIGRHFLTSDAPALMTVLENADRWDGSNVVFRDGRILLYDKKTKTPDMTYIDFGLGVVSASVLSDHQPDEAFDLSEVYTRLSRQGRLVGYEMHDRFYEIGSPAGLSETIAYLARRV